MISVRLLPVLGFGVAMLLRPAPAHAQLEPFAQAVGDLARANGQTGPARSTGIRDAADRMGTALVAWDRDIRALEDRIDAPGGAAPPAHLRHAELGVVYRARGRLADALREFEAAIAIRPSADLHLLRALTLETAGRSDEAGKAFRTAWTLDARDPVKSYYLARRPASGSEPDRDRARAVLTETYRMGLDARPAAAPFLTLGAIVDTLSRVPVVADETTADGFALLNTHHYGEAVAALKRAERVHGRPAGDSPLAHFVRGQRDELQNRVADARREYQTALAGALVGRSVLLVAIARLALVDGDLPAAIDAFARAAELNPNDPNIHKELATVLVAAGRADDGFCELMAALLINRRDAQAHAGIGQLYLDSGRAAEAVMAFNRALELMPDRYETRYALATALARLGHTDEAARQLDLFDRARRETLDRRRRDLATEVGPDDAVTQGVAPPGGAR